jgi:hypothetical protein
MILRTKLPKSSQKTGNFAVFEKQWKQVEIKWKWWNVCCLRETTCSF